jgi:hypothetical protein
VKLMAVMVAAVMTTAMTATMTAAMTAMPAARGRIACGRQCGGGERNHGNGGDEG